MQTTNTRRGFTLIELLVVVLIIALLAAVALPQYRKAVDKSRYAAMMAAVDAIKQSEELYYLENGTYTQDTAELNADIPSNCTLRSSTSYNCKTFIVYINDLGDVYGLRNKEPKLTYVMGYDNYSSVWRGKRLCGIGHSSQKDRAKEICLSFGGEQHPSYSSFFLL